MFLKVLYCCAFFLTTYFLLHPGNVLLQQKCLVAFFLKYYILNIFVHFLLSSPILLVLISSIYGPLGYCLSWGLLSVLLFSSG